MNLEDQMEELQKLYEELDKNYETLEDMYKSLEDQGKQKAELISKMQKEIIDLTTQNQEQVQKLEVQSFEINNLRLKFSKKPSLLSDNKPGKILKVNLADLSVQNPLDHKNIRQNNTMRGQILNVNDVYEAPSTSNR